MIRRRHVSLILAGCLALFVARAAWAGPPTNQLKAFLDGVAKSLENPALTGDGKAKERRVAVRRMANDIFDFSETAKRSLAGHWQDRTDKERQEFVMLFGDLLERSSSPRSISTGVGRSGTGVKKWTGISLRCPRR